MDITYKLSRVASFGKFVSLYWRSLILIIVPIICFPILLYDQSKAYKCLFIVCVMAFYWITEVLPLYITAMIPIVAFPMFGILGSDRTCQMYMKDTVVMFMGGVIIALAIEYSNLHKRVALKCISIVGCSQKKLNFGLIFVTMFVSMWISNTAAAAMMCPIVLAVLEELEAQGLCRIYKETSNDDGHKDLQSKQPSNITICYFLGTAYASSIGGIGTIVGTTTNLSFRGMFKDLFPNAPEIRFPDWMFYNIPGMLIITILTWVYLQWLYMGLFRPNSKAAKESEIGEEGEEIASRVIVTKYNELGTMNIQEIWVGVLFLLAVVLWFTRKPGFIKGWGDFLLDAEIDDSTPAIFIVILLFMIPSNFEFLNFFFNSNNNPLPKKSSDGLITWKFIHQKVPWGLMFLLGGGFALAEGGKVSGMFKIIGESLSGLVNLPSLVVLFIVCVTSTGITNFTSNVAVANIILPILAELSLAIKIHPLYLMYPACICCSMAFFLPVGTPPNALVAGVSNIKTKDMLIAGIGPSVFAIITTCLLFSSWGAVIYPDLKTFPDWAKSEFNHSINILHGR